MAGYALGVAAVVVAVAAVLGVGIGIWWLLWAPLERKP